MIHILFVPGAFGTMLEWGIRNYSDYYTSVPTEMLSDGSMHSLKKECHMCSVSELELLKTAAPDSITTPIYPMIDFTAVEVINFFEHNYQQDPKIFVSIPDLATAEFIMLMIYDKISVGLNHSYDIFCGNNENNVKQWNSAYQHWRDMQSWELREWLSLFYTTWVQEWIDAKNTVPESWLVIDPNQLIVNYHAVVEQCIQHCGMKYVPNYPADVTARTWCSKQAEVYKQYQILNTIVDCVIKGESYEFAPLNLIAQAIIQKRLRDQGYNLACFNLNDFPTNTQELHRLI